MINQVKAFDETVHLSNKKYLKLKVPHSEILRYASNVGAYEINEHLSKFSLYSTEEDAVADDTQIELGESILLLEIPKEVFEEVNVQDNQLRTLLDYQFIEPVTKGELSYYVMTVTGVHDHEWKDL